VAVRPGGTRVLDDRVGDRCASEEARCAALSGELDTGFSVGRHPPAHAFRPPPDTHAGVFAIERRQTPLVSDPRFGALVAKGFRRGVRAVASRAQLKQLGVVTFAEARDLDVHQWVALYEGFGGERRRPEAGAPRVG
jgi:16S rRNA A1518/A1519 N6-dimethyltransferase RsmA/KsgA/DIM1 with predicted DNA glycosylase/AP lyase activity